MHASEYLTVGEEGYKAVPQVLIHYTLAGKQPVLYCCVYCQEEEWNAVLDAKNLYGIGTEIEITQDHPIKEK